MLSHFVLKRRTTCWLTVCINFLELMCCNNGLAMLPYRHGKDIIDTHRYHIIHASESDSFYMLKFHFFLDGVFQNLVQLLLSCLDYAQPTVQGAFMNVHRLPRQEIEDVLQNFLQSSIPVTLPSPTGLQSKFGSQSGSGKLITMGSKQPHHSHTGRRWQRCRTTALRALTPGGT